ncbi:hypothetical protein E6O75_ATG08608 [Venturia nashicola]|uniref:Uncharacterized protein n=1 Tax=Venturia nashicola TaxID=86259 RepID=A0A4Z1NQV0_9PEZI|nr:hypothetical protein E6O75_ATG08608 [Venturia nashicola]
MFDKLRSKLRRRKWRHTEDASSDDGGWPQDSASGGGVDDDDAADDFGQAESDGWIPPDMADVLGGPWAASKRGAKRSSNRAEKVLPATSTDGRKHPHTRPRTRHRSDVQSEARQSSERRRPARRSAPREALPRATLQNRPVRGPRQSNKRREAEDSSLEGFEEVEGSEAPHGPYDTVGSIQRGVDMFQGGNPVPDVFMPHLAAHVEYPQHLALPYNMEHVHPSLYQGAPLIRGFPAHDAILESMQQNNRENYRGR